MVILHSLIFLHNNLFINFFSSYLPFHFLLLFLIFYTNKSHEFLSAPSFLKCFFILIFSLLFIYLFLTIIHASFFLNTSLLILLSCCILLKIWWFVEHMNKLWKTMNSSRTFALRHTNKIIQTVRCSCNKNSMFFFQTKFSQNILNSKFTIRCYRRIRWRWLYPSIVRSTHMTTIWCKFSQIFLSRNHTKYSNESQKTTTEDFTSWIFEKILIWIVNLVLGKGEENGKESWGKLKGYRKNS